MEKLNIFIKSIIGLLILIIVLISGCINSNNQTPIAQPTINLHANQIILDDTEIKEVLGNDWEQKDMWVDKSTKDGEFVLLSDIRKGYDNPNITSKGGYFRNKIQIAVYVSRDISSTNTNYQLMLSNLQIGGNVINNKFDIGDYGEIYTYMGLQEGLNGQTDLEFKRSNIIISIYAIPEINIDIISKLAKKQDAKILKILDMIK